MAGDFFLLTHWNSLKLIQGLYNANKFIFCYCVPHVCTGEFVAV